MKSEDEIREELNRINEKIESTTSGTAYIDMLMAYANALEWVLS